MSEYMFVNIKTAYAVINGGDGGISKRVECIFDNEFKANQYANYLRTRWSPQSFRVDEVAIDTEMCKEEDED